MAINYFSGEIINSEGLDGEDCTWDWNLAFAATQHSS